MPQNEQTEKTLTREEIRSLVSQLYEEQKRLTNQVVEKFEKAKQPRIPTRAEKLVYG